MADAKTKRMGMVKVGLEVLGDMLHLPKGMHVCQVIEMVDDVRKKRISLIVSGNGVPETPSDECIPDIGLDYIRKSNCPMCEQPVVKMIGANLLDKADEKKAPEGKKQ